MTFRSRLFATVALPVLAGSLIATPTLADALMKPFEVAQESTDQQQLTPEELLLLQQQQEAQRAAEEEAQRQAAEQQKAAEEEAARAAAEAEAQRQAEEQQRAAEEEAQRQAAEQQKAAEEEAARAAAEQQKAAEEEAARAAEEEAQRQAAEQQKAAEEEAARAAAEQQKAAEDEAARAAAEQQKAAEDEAARAAAEQQKAAEEEAARAAAEAEAQRAAEEQKAAEEQQQQQEQQQQAEEPVQQEGEQPAVAGEEIPVETNTEQPSTAETGTEQPGTTETETQQPSTAETGETPVIEPVQEIVDTMSEEQKQEIAEDPAQTNETILLPVENGTAVLDSDKDADNIGGQASRDVRSKQREEVQTQQEEEPLPDSDRSAQAALSAEVLEAAPEKMQAAIAEEGQRVEVAPVFAVPETTNIVNNTVINNTIVNNNTTINNNNTTVNNTITQVNVVEKVENRVVLSIGNQLVVRGDDRPRLRRDSEEVYYDNLARGRVRETIVRPGGIQIVTIYNRYGDIIQRSRIGRDGREYILVYAPEREDDAPRPSYVDVGYELPPMRLRIPVRDYIIDTSSEPDRDYYDFLAEPPVERVERVYTIDEVKQSARLRDKVRRIDLDTVTFASGSAEVPMSQARTLRKVAEAMQKVLDKDPGETFLIEGHTDAVGADKPNLVLSDERAESVASLLTEVYGIPPENLQTQGYGERFLKIRTPAADQQNRRVTIRRVTTLVRPVASAN